MSAVAPFPVLTITQKGVLARGEFAESLASFVDPDRASVDALDRRLAATKTGVVAHFYMDAELQGVLFSCAWPHIHISDSLVMADRAVDMVRAGAERIVVLGVDFMAENVRAMLDDAGFATVPVYRVDERAIGCTLAAAAESPAYAAYLETAAKTPGSVHVVYINTSLRTKAHAHAKIPTITCTSSNVVRVVLQAFAQLPQGHVWFGPDSYMGENLRAMLETMATWSDEDIRRVHPAHDVASIRRALPRFHWFSAGNCVVHHMFGRAVTAQIRRDWGHAFITAHLEVPGALFELGLAAQREGRGVVGSTADILRAISKAVSEAPPGTERCTFVLGTEASMVTSIVREVRAKLRARAPDDDLAVEIVFPVAAEAIATTGQVELPIVPGASGGEGCSVGGGCATCPYMRMNSLDALMDVLAQIEQGREAMGSLRGYAPRTYGERIEGQTIAFWGCGPILAMRDFQRDGLLPAALIERAAASAPSPGPM